jgi:predicted DNA-binding ribbon-helix-helix protein
MASNSSQLKRSVVVAGRKTSVSLEGEFWKALKEIAARRNMTLSDLIATIEAKHRHGNLSSGIRLFVLNFYSEELAILDRREAAQEAISRSVATKPQ